MIKIGSSLFLTNVVFLERNKYIDPPCVHVHVHMYTVYVFICGIHAHTVGLAWYKKRFVSCFKYSKKYVSLATNFLSGFAARYFALCCDKYNFIVSFELCTGQLTAGMRVPHCNDNPHSRVKILTKSLVYE